MKTEIKSLPLASLCTTNEYQRAYKSGKEKLLAEGFDESACQQILISARENGSLVIIDGRHTVAAAMRRGIKSLNCKVVHGLSIEEEARLFRLRNTLRANPKQIEIFFSRLVEREPVALQLKALVESCGFKISKSSGVVCNSKAVSTLEGIFRKSPDRLRQVLEIIYKIWPEDRANGESKIFDGMNLLLDRLQPRVDLLKRIVDKLVRVPLLSIFRAAKGRQEIDGLHARDALAIALLEQINKGSKYRLTLIPRKERGRAD